MAGDPKIQIDITARDDASAKIEDVADAAEGLEKIAPEVTVTADTGGVVADLEAVGDQAAQLSRADTELVIRAKIDQAKGELKQLETALEGVRDKAVDTAHQLDRVDGPATGGGLRGNAISDLTGPLGEASSAASDFAGVFDGLGDAAAASAGKLGLSQGAADKLGSAIGGLGVAVAAGAALWSLWSAKAEAARQKARELAEAQEGVADAIRDGNREAALQNFHKAYDDAIGAAEKFGLKQQDIVRFITGEAEAIPGLTSRYRELEQARADNAQEVAKAQAAGERSTSTAAAEADAFLAVVAGLEDQRQAYADATAASGDHKAADDALARQLGFTDTAQKDLTASVKAGTKAMGDAADAVDEAKRSYDALDERLSDKRAIEDFQAAMIEAQNAIHDKSAETVVDIRAVEDSIIQAGKTADLNPIDVETAINMVEQGKVDEAFQFMQSKIDAKGPLNMNLKIHPELPPRLRIVTRGGTVLLDEALQPLASAAAPAPAGNTFVTIAMPPGSRGVDVVRQVSGSARRSGRHYGAPVVNYARR